MTFDAKKQLFYTKQNLTHKSCCHDAIEVAIHAYVGQPPPSRDSITESEGSHSGTGGWGGGGVSHYLGASDRGSFAPGSNSLL